MTDQHEQSRNWLARFWQQPNWRYRNFVFVYLILILNFLLPAISYYADRAGAIERFYQLGSLFDQTQPAVEDSYIWWILGAGNVMALAFMCALMLINLRRFYPVLPALVALKGFSSLGFALLYLAGPHHVTFLGAALLDGVTVVVMIYFAVQAHRQIDRNPQGLVPRPVDPTNLLLFGRRGRRHLTSVANAVMPSQTERGNSQSEASVRSVDPVVEQIESAPFKARLGFRLAVAFVYFAPLVVIGRPRLLSGLVASDRKRYFERLESHRSYLVRQTLVLTKAALAFAYVGQEHRQLGAYSRKTP